MRQTRDDLPYMRQACLMKTSMRNIAGALGFMLVVFGFRTSASDDMLIYSSVPFVPTYASEKMAGI